MVLPAIGLWFKDALSTTGNAFAKDMWSWDAMPTALGCSKSFTVVVVCCKLLKFSLLMPAILPVVRDLCGTFLWFEVGNFCQKGDGL